MLAIILTILQTLFATLEQKPLQSTVTLSISAPNTQTITYKGSVTMQGERFLVDLMDYNMAYDGKTLYVYSEDDDELTLSRPTPEQLQESNPLLMAKAFARESNATERTSSDGKTTTITLTPKDQTKGIKRIVVRVDTATMLPLSIEMQEDKSTSTLRFSSPKYIDKAPSFVLSKPGAFVNDLR